MALPLKKNVYSSSASQSFLYNSSMFPILYGATAGLVDIQTINLKTTSLSDLASRASILLNSMVQTVQSPATFTGSFPQNKNNLPMYGCPHIPADGLELFPKNTNQSQFNPVDRLPTSTGFATYSSAPFVCISTNATVLCDAEVYQPDYTWVQYW